MLAMNAEAIPWAISEILRGAFTLQAAGGGALGAMIIGFQRAVFSNEAGIGSATIAHAAVRTDHPASEGYVALLEPFIDTVIICSATALVVVTTFYYQPNFADGLDGIAITSAAFERNVSWSPYALALAATLFALSTMISWSYYGLKGFTYLAGDSPKRERIFMIVFCIFVALEGNWGQVPIITKIRQQTRGLQLEIGTCPQFFEHVVDGQAERRPLACRGGAQPLFDFGHDRHRLTTAPLGQMLPALLLPLDCLHAALNLVELGDQVEHLLRLGVIGCRLVKSSSRVDPACRDLKRWRESVGAVRSQQRGVGVVAVDHDSITTKPVERCARRLGGAVRVDGVKDRVLTTDRPHPPLLRGFLLHQPPSGLIHTDHRRSEHILAQRLVAGLKVSGQSKDLVPQGLRCHLKPLATHLLALARQRQVQIVLPQHHGNCEIHRVASTGDQLWRAQGGFNVPALTPALLALVAYDAERALDDVYLLGALELPLPLLEVIAALGARLVSGVELVDNLDGGQLRLRGGAVSGGLLLLFGSLLVVAAASLFRRGSVDVLVDTRELVLEATQLEFELHGILPFGGAQFFGELHQAFVQARVLGIEEAGDPSQLLDVALCFNIDHSARRLWHIYPKMSTPMRAFSRTISLFFLSRARGALRATPRPVSTALS